MPDQKYKYIVAKREFVTELVVSPLFGTMWFMGEKFIVRKVTNWFIVAFYWKLRYRAVMGRGSFTKEVSHVQRG